MSSYEISLQQELQRRNRNLAGRLPKIYEEAEKILVFTQSKYPYFTPHGISHSRTVEENLNWLIPDDIKQKMNPWELFFLIVAAWLHDWGMVVGQNEELTADDARAEHHIRTEQKLSQNYKEVFLEYHEVLIIGRICRGHRLEDLRDENYSTIAFRSGVRVDRAFLAAILRLADECDVTSERVNEVMFYELDPTKRSAEEFKKHLQVVGVGHPPGQRFKIEIHALAWDPDGSQLLRKLKDKMQRTLDEIKVILSRREIEIDYVDLRLESRGFIDKPIRFILDSQRITQLLIGEQLYSRNDVVVRELLQNSIDACRAWQIIEPEFSPKIEVYKNENYLVIEDNGIGMNFETAKYYLAIKGKSFYDTEEFKQIIKGSKFDPISRFGIGILSCFLISDKIIIETKRSGETACQFTIEDLNKGWLYRKGMRKEPGTKVTLTLNEKGQDLNLEEALSHYIKTVTIPIFLKVSDRPQKQFEQNWNDKIPEVNEKVVPGAYESKAKLIRTESLIRDDFDVTFYLYDRPRLDTNVFIANHGIYVGSTRLGILQSNHVLALVNLKSRVLDIKISREDIVKNEKYYRFIKNYYGRFFKLIIDIAHTQATEIKTSSIKKAVLMASVLGKFLTMSGSYNEKLTKESLISAKHFFRVLKLPFVTKNDVWIGSLEKGLDKYEHHKIFLYMMRCGEYEIFSYEIDSTLPFIQNILNNDQVCIINPVPALVSPGALITSSYQDKSLLSMILNKMNVQYSITGFFNILSQVPLKIVKTSLDYILPNGSNFARLHKEFRSLLIQKAPYILQLLSSNVDIHDLKTDLSNHNTEALLICSNYLYKDTGIDSLFSLDIPSPRYKFLCPGQYIYDIQDEFISWLITNSEKIFSDKVLVILIRTYFIEIQRFYLSKSIHCRHKCAEVLINALENCIISKIGKYSGYRSLTERLGKNLNVLELECVYSEPMKLVK